MGAISQSCPHPTPPRSWPAANERRRQDESAWHPRCGACEWSHHAGQGRAVCLAASSRALASRRTPANTAVALTTLYLNAPSPFTHATRLESAVAFHKHKTTCTITKTRRHAPSQQDISKTHIFPPPCCLQKTPLKLAGGVDVGVAWGVEVVQDTGLRHRTTPLT